MNHYDHISKFRFGSASFASHREIFRSGMFKKGGLFVGYYNNKRLAHHSDGAILTIAGAAGSKTTGQLAYTCCEPSSTQFSVPMMIHDPKGELAAISRNALVLGKTPIAGYYWNPKNLHGLGCHSINPLDDLTADSPHLHTDIQLTAQDLIPSGSGDDNYFNLRARGWVSAFMKSLAECGGVSLPSLYRLVNRIEANPSAWADDLETMLNSRFDDVRRTASEILNKQVDAPKEYSGILGVLFNQLSFLDDDALRDSLEGGDGALSVLIGQKQTARIYLIPPAEYIELWSPVLRIMFSRLIMLKGRAGSARRVALIVDEAGQLGRATFLLRAFTFARGAGLNVHALFQDIGQIKRNLGRDSLTSFMGSGVVRQFFAIRDFETAQMISSMLGQATISYCDEAAQARAKKEARSRAKAAFFGNDPFHNAQDYRHYEDEAQRHTKMRRPLMTPDEILNMKEDQQILFTSGNNLYPILANKYPYFKRRSMAGRYLPNPFHPPLDKVRVKSIFGSKWLPVKSVPIPNKFRHLPQYKNQNTMQQIGSFTL